MLAHRRFREVDLAEQRLVDRRRAEPVLDAEGGAGVALRVEVDHQHPHPVQGERGREVDGARGLADAALLVGDGQHPAPRRPGHPVPVRVQHPGRARRLFGDRRPARAAAMFHVKHRTGSRNVHVHPLLRRRRSTTTTVLGGSTMPTPHVSIRGIAAARCGDGAGVPLHLGGGGHALHGEHHPTRADEGKAPRGESVQRSDRTRRDHVGSLPSPAGPGCPRPGPARPRRADRDPRAPRATTRPAGRAAPRERPADPAGPAPTVSRAGPHPDPMSRTRAPGGTRSATTAQFRTWRSHTRGASRGPTRPHSTPVVARCSA